MDGRVNVVEGRVVDDGGVRREVPVGIVRLVRRTVPHPLGGPLVELGVDHMEVGLFRLEPARSDVIAI